MYFTSNESVQTVYKEMKKKGMEWASNSLNIYLLDSSSVNFVYKAPPPLPVPIKWTFFARKLVERKKFVKPASRDLWLWRHRTDER